MTPEKSLMAQGPGKAEQARLREIMQTGLEQSLATLRTMLDGRIEFRPQEPVWKNAGVKIQLGLHGALEGGMYIELPEHMADEIVKRLTAGKAQSLLNENARSALMEVGNILASVFVAHFDRSRGLRTLPSPPQLSFAPLELPQFAFCYAARLCWSQCPEQGEVLIGMQQPALDILLA